MSKRTAKKRTTKPAATAAPPSQPETFEITREEAFELRALYAEAAQLKVAAEHAAEQFRIAAEAFARARDAMTAKYSEGGTYDVASYNFLEATGVRTKRSEGGAS